MSSAVKIPTLPAQTLLRFYLDAPLPNPTESHPIPHDMASPIRLLALLVLLFTGLRCPAADRASREAEADAFFSGPILRWKLRLSDAAMDSLRADPREYVPAELTVGGRTYPGVGVHLKGSAGSKRSVDDRPALTLNFDAAAAGPDAKPLFNWYRKQFAKLGLRLVIRLTDYNRFQDKISKGSVQIFFWGWLADYPDAENFLFLLHGPTGKTKHDGENTANYESAAFDKLFEQMKLQDDGPQKQALVDQQVRQAGERQGDHEAERDRLVAIHGLRVNGEEGQGDELHEVEREAGFAEEHARGILPFDYRQHFVVSFSLRAFLHFMDLRAKLDAQEEIRVLCDLMWPHMQAWAPEIAAWYEKSRLHKARLAP